MRHFFVSGWLLFFQAAMMFYSIRCLFYPETAINSFTEKVNVRFDPGELEMTKRIGIVYALCTILGLIVINLIFAAL